MIMIRGGGGGELAYDIMIRYIINNTQFATHATLLVMLVVTDKNCQT